MKSAVIYARVSSKDQEREGYSIPAQLKFLREYVEKTDRLYRNLRDCLTLEDLDVEIHLPKEGQIISKNAKSQSKLIHGFHVVMARNYIENLREEVKKGMREKAEQGVYPSRPPFGYRNNKLERSIEVDPQSAPLAR